MRYLCFFLALLSLASCYREGEYRYADAPKASNAAGVQVVVTDALRRAEALALQVRIENKGTKPIVIGGEQGLGQGMTVAVQGASGKSWRGATRVTRCLRVEPAVPAGSEQVQSYTILPGADATFRLQWLFRPRLKGAHYRWDLLMKQEGGDLALWGTAPPCHCPKDKLLEAALAEEDDSSAKVVSP